MPDYDCQDINVKTKAPMFPKQTDNVGQKVKVAFNYDTSVTYFGTIVRDDEVAPYVSIIKLGENKYVLSFECMWQFVEDEYQFAEL